MEVLYAMTAPSFENDEVELKNGKTIKITEKLPKYSEKNNQYEEVRKHCTFGRTWEAGPSNVDSVEPNPRGFRNLTGNVNKQTSTPYSVGGNYIALGCVWDFRLEDCLSPFFSFIHPWLPRQDVGLRLIFR